MNKLSLLAFSFTLFFASCKNEPVGGEYENSHWKLTALKDAGKLLPLPEGQTTLVFKTEELTGQAACNTYFADIEVDGVKLTLGDIGATRRACDDLDFENQYFQALRTAYGYSVLADKLVIFTDNGGEITFSRMTDSERDADNYANGAGKLASQFGPLEGGIMPHLYPIVRVDNPGKYPYRGVLVDTAMYQYFDPEVSSIWKSTGGDVMAVGKFEDFFICRVPGRYVSSDIAIFRLKNGQFKHSETVAWAWCDEGWCNQQDAWLKDIDKDGRTDLIQHYTLTDDKGKVREERLTVMLQEEDGSFTKDETLELDKSQFPMAKI